MKLVKDYVYDRRTDDTELFTETAKEDAEKLLGHYQCKNSLLTNVFNIDIDKRVSEESLLFQRRYSSLVGISDRFNTLKMDLDKIADGKGPFVVEFLQNTHCSSDQNPHGKTCESIGEYESSRVLVSVITIQYYNLQICTQFCLLLCEIDFLQTFGQ